MENVIKNFNLIKQEIADKKNVKLIAVTKTFPISHILPVINETFSLTETVQIILNENEYISQIIIITSKTKTTKESFDTINYLQNKFKKIIFINICFKF